MLVNRASLSRAWWRYALEAVKVMIVHKGGSAASLRLDPNLLAQRIRLKKQYIDLWVRKLTAVAMDTNEINEVR